MIRSKCDNKGCILKDTCFMTNCTEFRFSRFSGQFSHISPCPSSIFPSSPLIHPSLGGPGIGDHPCSDHTVAGQKPQLRVQVLRMKRGRTPGGRRSVTDLRNLIRASPGKNKRTNKRTKTAKTHHVYRLQSPHVCSPIICCCQCLSRAAFLVQGLRLPKRCATLWIHISGHPSSAASPAASLRNT